MDSLSLQGKRAKYYSRYFNTKEKMISVFPLKIPDSCVVNTLGPANAKIIKGDSMYILVYYLSVFFEDDEHAVFNGTTFEITVKDNIVIKYSLMIN